METRDILVVIENAAIVPQRIAPAVALASRFGARLAGFFGSGYPIMASYGDVSGWSQLVDAYMEAQRREATAAGAAFRDALNRDNCRASGSSGKPTKPAALLPRRRSIISLS